MGLLAAMLVVLSAAPVLAEGVREPPGNYPFVEIRNEHGDKIQGPVATNVVPLWPVRSCFGWVVTVPWRNRYVEFVEVQRMPAPTRFEGGGFSINEASDTTTATRRAYVGADGRLRHAWCINDADPEGTVIFEIDVEGRRIAEFKFCAVRVPAAQPVRLDALVCPQKFLGS